jgi:hypothetical protein
MSRALGQSQRIEESGLALDEDESPFVGLLQVEAA